MIDVNNNRYFPPEALAKELANRKLSQRLQTVGYSHEKRPILSLDLGSGQLKVLAWSQMHGNETTTTKALLDVIDYLETTHEGATLQKELRVKLIFQLNPDGSARYTRINANEVDLNRDAKAQSQPEMKVLMEVYNTFNPDLCLNLHGQRTIFAAGNTKLPASLSFLAPAADPERTITPARQVAMQLIARISGQHTTSDVWGIGRYDDSFNINCTGDYFTAQGTPTILFEAGHYPNDYMRKETRKLVAQSIIDCLKSFSAGDYNDKSTEDYFAIPANSNHLRDIEISNVTIVNNKEITKSTFFVQYKEVLDNNEIIFTPEFDGSDCKLSGLKKIQMPEEQEKYPINRNDFADVIMDSLKKFIQL